MAYRLSAGDRLIPDSLSIILYPLSSYDRLTESAFDYDCDELLYERSALEFVRDQLNDAQRAELDIVDAHWRANPAAFNAAFALFHKRKIIEAELEGYVYDADSLTPAIPRAHWWWWPIEGDA